MTAATPVNCWEAWDREGHGMVRPQGELRKYIELGTLLDPETSSLGLNMKLSPWVHMFKYLVPGS